MDEQLLAAIEGGSWTNGGVMIAVVAMVAAQFKGEIKTVFSRRNGNGKSKANGGMSGSTIRQDAQTQLLVEQIHEIVVDTKETTRTTAEHSKSMAATLEKIEENTRPK